VSTNFKSAYFFKSRSARLRQNLPEFLLGISLSGRFCCIFFVAWFLHCTYMKCTCAIQNMQQVQNAMHTFFVFKKCLCILTMNIFFNLQILFKHFRYHFLGQITEATINVFVLKIVLAKNKRAERTS